MPVRGWPLHADVRGPASARGTKAALPRNQGVVSSCVPGRPLDQRHMLVTVDHVRRATDEFHLVGLLQATADVWFFTGRNHDGIASHP